ncbi:DUF1761 family protein [Rhodovibrionaceae bacterium A322]
MEDFASVNWLAVVIGTVVAFLAGWAWYSPLLFGLKWAAGSGVSLDRAEKMPLVAMVSQVMALFLLSLILGLTETQNALVLALLVIAMAAAFSLSAGGFIQKSSTALAVDAGYIVTAGVIMILSQGLIPAL